MGDDGVLARREDDVWVEETLTSADLTSLTVYNGAPIVTGHGSTILRLEGDEWVDIAPDLLSSTRIEAATGTTDALVALATPTFTVGRLLEPAIITQPAAGAAFGGGGISWTAPAAPLLVQFTLIEFFDPETGELQWSVRQRGVASSASLPDVTCLPGGPEPGASRVQVQRLHTGGAFYGTSGWSFAEEVDRSSLNYTLDDQPIEWSAEGCVEP